MGRTSLRGVIGVLALAIILAGKLEPVLAQARKSDSVVKVEVTADKPDADGKQTITITLDIDKDWHIYANPVDNEDLTNAQTVVSVTSKGKLTNVKIVYPPGKLEGEKGEKYKVYEGRVAVKAQVKRAKGDNRPLEVAIKLQACDARTCLVPTTIKKEVP